jgi:hypothetical protein
MEIFLKTISSEAFYIDKKQVTRKMEIRRRQWKGDKN